MTRAMRESAFTTVKRPSHWLAQIEPSVDHQFKYKGQTARAGLGSVKERYSANVSAKDHRARCAKAVADQDQGVAYQHTVSLAWQSVWSNWADDVIPFDLSWRNLIYGPGPKLIAFVLNATINWAQTPDLLLLWGKSKVSKCALCGASPCSLHHILVNCSVALNGKRYTWRHDSVLNTIQPVLEHHLRMFNQSPPMRLPAISSSFVPAGAAAKPKAPLHRAAAPLLQGACDWRLLVDFDHAQIVFPPEICATNERPDIIIWSPTRRVILIELTCPAEEGIVAARIRKEARYMRELIPLVKEAKPPWSCELVTMEAGARGGVPFSFKKTLRRLGFSSRRAGQMCRAVSEVCARTSYTIWLSRAIPHWDAGRDLLSVSIIPFTACPGSSAAARGSSR